METKDKLVGFTVKLPEAVHIEYKKACIDDKASLQQMTEGLIRVYLADKAEQKIEDEIEKRKL